MSIFAQIHPVYTPKDSLVIEGSFLQGYAMGTQLEVFKIEDTTLRSLKFCFHQLLRGINEMPNDVRKQVVEFRRLCQRRAKKIKKSIPGGIENAQLLVLSLEAYVLRASAAIEASRRAMVLQQSSDNSSEASQLTQGERRRGSNWRMKSEVLSEASQSNDGEDKDEMDLRKAEDNPPVPRRCFGTNRNNCGSGLVVELPVEEEKESVYDKIEKTLKKKR
ncbi:hypothetical protein BJ742DRAFT_736008 [Cladochytrium replicatum]|nr:hypothetical protein BJ742DRAFT_736008 [Cladochytrium replicatum]